MLVLNSISDATWSESHIDCKVLRKSSCRLLPHSRSSPWRAFPQEAPVQVHLTFITRKWCYWLNGTRRPLLKKAGGFFFPPLCKKETKTRWNTNGISQHNSVKGQKVKQFKDLSKCSNRLRKRRWLYREMLKKVNVNNEKQIAYL